MSSTEPGSGDEPRDPKISLPGPDAEKPLDLAADVQLKKVRSLTLTERYEIRVDSIIAVLKGDKEHFREDAHRLRTIEIHQLRNDIRWLEDLASRQRQSLSRLQTSYEWANAFNWLSCALIAIGGGVVSYAAFIPLHQKITASGGFVALLIGVGVQAMVSYRGTRALLGDSDRPPDTRPTPNPQPGLLDSSRRANP